MNIAVPASGVRGSSILLYAALVALALALFWFVGQRLHYLADYSVDSYTPYYWPRRAGLLLHLAGGSIAISTGLVQIWLGLTRRIGPVHRVLGKVYAAGVLMGCTGGFYLVSTIPGHLPYRGGLLMLCVAWVITTGMALYAIRTRRLEQHREWMLRSYTVTFAFVTYRLVSMWLNRWIHVPEDPIADDIDTLMAWSCWAVPLLIAEPLIQLRAMRRSRKTAA
ncbi:MAG TPA: DUF2306 domain-containing protein [Steroidobacteraceae bacterium]|jgi:uncharacterized membrane protein|nr:DUF2306 domain-containing protein [Steroidobacteraceae bacterium]